MELVGKMAICWGTPQAEELVFAWETETYTESGDADARSALRAGGHGSVPMNALYNPARLRFRGMFSLTPQGWLAGHVSVAGEVVGTPSGLYQCTVPGKTGGTVPAWGGQVVTDNEARWEKRNDIYAALRWLRDEFDRFFHAGLLRLYLDDDRYHFAQCISRQFQPSGPSQAALEWEAEFEAPDPRRYDTTPFTATMNTPATLAIWQAGIAVAKDAVRAMPNDAGRSYICTAAGRSGTLPPFGPWTAPVWRADTEYAVGDVVRPPVPNGRIYVCDIPGVSGHAAPVFADTGVVHDGGVDWAASETFVDQNVEAWSPTSEYGQGAAVRPETPTGWLWIATVAGTSGTNEPAGSAVEGATFADGSVTWQAKRAAVWQYSGYSPQGVAVATVKRTGNAPGEPYIVLTVPDAALNIVVANITTGQECSIKGRPMRAGELVIDCETGTVTLDEEDAFGLFDGEFLDLSPGDNSIQVSWQEPGPTVVVITARDRWW